MSAGKLKEINMKNNLFCILKVTEDGVRSRVGSVSINQRYGSSPTYHGSPTPLRIPFIKLGMTIIQVSLSILWIPFIQVGMTIIWTPIKQERLTIILIPKITYLWGDCGCHTESHDHIISNLPNMVHSARTVSSEPWDRLARTDNCSTISSPSVHHQLPAIIGTMVQSSQDSQLFNNV